MKTIIGIDPGLTGAIAVLGPDGETVIDMPIAVGGLRGHKSQVDALTLGMELGAHPDATVFVEVQGARPGEGVSSSHTNGTNFGIILGVLGALRMRWEPVAAQKWRPAMVGHRGQGESKRDKGPSLATARRLFPALASYLERKKDHGRAEALLIAEWGRRRLGGGA